MRPVVDGNEPAALVPAVHPDQSLDPALQLFGSHRQLRVVSRRDARQLLGVLTLEGALRAYGVQPQHEETGMAPPQPGARSTDSA